MSRKQGGPGKEKDKEKEEAPPPPPSNPQESAMAPPRESKRNAETGATGSAKTDEPQYKEEGTGKQKERVYTNVIVYATKPRKTAPNSRFFLVSFTQLRRAGLSEAVYDSRFENPKDHPEPHSVRMRSRTLKGLMSFPTDPKGTPKKEQLHWHLFTVIEHDVPERRQQGIAEYCNSEFVKYKKHGKTDQGNAMTDADVYDRMVNEKKYRILHGMHWGTPFRRETDVLPGRHSAVPPSATCTSGLSTEPSEAEVDDDYEQSEFDHPALERRQKKPESSRASQKGYVGLADAEADAAAVLKMRSSTSSTAEQMAKTPHEKERAESVAREVSKSVAGGPGKKQARKCKAAATVRKEGIQGSGHKEPDKEGEPIVVDDADVLLVAQGEEEEEVAEEEVGVMAETALTPVLGPQDEEMAQVPAEGEENGCPDPPKDFTDIINFLGSLTNNQKKMYALMRNFSTTMKQTNQDLEVNTKMMGRLEFTILHHEQGGRQLKSLFKDTEEINAFFYKDPDGYKNSQMTVMSAMAAACMRNDNHYMIAALKAVCKPAYLALHFYPKAGNTGNAKSWIHPELFYAVETVGRNYVYAHLDVPEKDERKVFTMDRALSTAMTALSNLRNT
jgi:hypothetical protein